jgi:hypothetical protein
VVTADNALDLFVKGDLAITAPQVAFFEFIVRA